MELVVCRYKLRPESTSLLSIVMSIRQRSSVVDRAAVLLIDKRAAQLGFCLARSEEQALSLIPMNLLAIEMSKEEAEGITFGGLAGTKTLWSVAELAARESDWKAGYGVIIFDANGLRQFSADEPLAH
jgi:hypothetical protein